MSISEDCPVDENIPQEILQSTALSKQDWSKAQREDRNICLILDFIACGQLPDVKQVEALGLDKRYIKEWGRFKVEEGILLRCFTQQGQDTQQLVLPAKFREDMFKAYYEYLEHQGRDRTLSLMKRRLYWPGMSPYVKSKIKQCGRCIRRKILPTRAADLVNITSTAPMEVVCIDYPWQHGRLSFLPDVWAPSSFGSRCLPGHSSEPRIGPEPTRLRWQAETTYGLCLWDRFIRSQEKCWKTEKLLRLQSQIYETGSGWSRACEERRPSW